jgi:soluble epoxide hydrolase/lipid-phosphate phosphatase
VYRVYQYYPKLISHVFSICVPYFPPSREFMSLENFVEALPHFGYQLQLASGEVENRLTTKEDMRLFLNAMFGGWGDAINVESGIKFENLTKLKKTKLLSEAVSADFLIA